MKRKQKIKEDNLKKTAHDLNKVLNYNDEKLFKTLDIKSIGDVDSRKNRITKFGLNHRVSKQFNYFKEYLKSLFEPFNVLLLIIGTVELLIWAFYNPVVNENDGVGKVLELVSALIIFLMVILASVVDFIQELIAFKNSAKLIKLINNKVFLVDKNVNNLNEINDDLLINNTKKINDDLLTKGDLIYLKSGDIVPADLKIIWSSNLYVDQSTLTGEIQPIYKSVEAKQTKNIFEASNLLISDTKIVQGKVLGLVLNIGSESYANKIIAYSEESNDETDYEIGLKKVTKIILFLILGFFPIVFVISGFRTGQWISSIIFAISMVVSLIPESLPAIMSSNLQVGSKKMSKEQIVIKNFKAVQNLGSTTIIATDKTGTLTTGKLEVVDYLNVDFKKDDELLKQTYLSVYFQNNLSNQIEDSINSFWKKQFENVDFTNYQLVASEEFDFHTRLTSVLLKENNQYIQITKGAPSEILAITNLSDAKKTEILNHVYHLESLGKKTILIAKKTNSKKIVKNNLDFYGIIVFVNENKPGIKKVVKMIDDYHLKLKVLTGDSQLVAKRTCEDLGLKNTELITGNDFSKLNHQLKLEAVEKFGIFAKLNPLEKAEVVTDLQENKEVVTYLGDGINDVVALKKADVGISVNNGSATAKAASDVILLKKDLAILETGILEGRKIFTNAIKFIKIVVTMNFSLLVTILIASSWFDFNPMSPIQLLLQNLIYDFMNLAFVWDNVDKDYIKKPQAWKPKSVLTFGLFNGIVPIIISITNFLVIGYGFNLFNDINNSLGSEKIFYIQQFQTAFFLETLTTHIILVIVYRTDKWAIIQSRPSLTLSLVLLGFISLGFFLIYTPVVNSTLGYQQMTNNWYLLYYFGSYFVVYLLGDCSKMAYKKIFFQWI